MSGWGFDFSQVSLSSFGEKLQQLKEDVESSIDAQLRADRLGLETGDSAEAGSSSPAAEGWGFDALEDFANAVLGSGAAKKEPNTPSAGQDQGPEAAQASRPPHAPHSDVRVLPRPVPFSGEEPTGSASPNTETHHPPAPSLEPGARSSGLDAEAGPSSSPETPSSRATPAKDAVAAPAAAGDGLESSEHTNADIRDGEVAATSRRCATARGRPRASRGGSGSLGATRVGASPQPQELPPASASLPWSVAGEAASSTDQTALTEKLASEGPHTPHAAGDAVAEAPASEAPEVEGGEGVGWEGGNFQAASLPAVECASSEKHASAGGGDAAERRQLGEGLSGREEAGEGNSSEECTLESLPTAEAERPEEGAGQQESHLKERGGQGNAAVEAAPAAASDFGSPAAGGARAAEAADLTPDSVSEDEHETPPSPAAAQASTAADASGPAPAPEVPSPAHPPPDHPSPPGDAGDAARGQEGLARGEEASPHERGGATPTSPVGLPQQEGTPRSAGSPPLPSPPAATTGNEGRGLAAGAGGGERDATAPAAAAVEGGEGRGGDLPSGGGAGGEERGAFEERSEAAAKVPAGGEGAAGGGELEGRLVGQRAQHGAADATPGGGEGCDGGPGVASHLEEVHLHNLQKTIRQLQEALAAREEQIERKNQEVVQAQSVMEQLVRRNEELALQKAIVSEGDVAEMQREFEQRLAASERKVYALTKERDALRRGSEKLSSFDELVKEKDAIIQEVMAEGEALSRKQLQQEQTIKRLRGQVKELKATVSDLTDKLAAESSRADGAASERASTAGELAAIREQHAADLAAERQQYEGLLQEARAAQAAAEQRVADSLKQGAQRRLRESEARVEMLEGSVAQLREELERQRAAADEREDLLSNEVSELQRRCGEAEARQQEMAARVPEATAPLLRQIEAMQEEARSQSLVWAEAEQALSQRLQQAEQAAAAADAERGALSEQLLEAQALVEKAQGEVQELRQQLQHSVHSAREERRRREAADVAVGHLKGDLASAHDSLNTLERVYAQQMEALQSREEAAMGRAKTLESQLQQVQGAGDIPTPHQPAAKGPPPPPALAAPGFKWVLVQEGEGVPAAASSQLPARDASGEVLGDAGEGDGGGAVAGSRRGPEGDGEDTTIRGQVLWGRGAAVSGSVAAQGQLRSVPSGAAGSEAQLAALQQTIRELELTRDRLSEELVRASTQAAEGQAAISRAAALEDDLRQLHLRHDACVVLLGEKQERIEELSDDLQEVKLTYRQQIDFMAQEIVRLQRAQQELEAQQARQGALEQLLHAAEE